MKKPSKFGYLKIVRFVRERANNMSNESLNRCQTEFEKYYGAPLNTHGTNAFTMAQHTAWTAWKACWKICKTPDVHKVAVAIQQECALQNMNDPDFISIAIKALEAA